MKVRESQRGSFVRAERRKETLEREKSSNQSFGVENEFEEGEGF